jgi:hypothetical protein
MLLREGSATSVWDRHWWRNLKAKAVGIDSTVGIDSWNRQYLKTKAVGSNPEQHGAEDEA